MRDARDVIVRPVVTEKAQLLQERRNQFVFEVDRRSNKVEIKNAIESIWGVEITSVRTMRVSGKQKSLGFKFRSRGGGYSSSWKKAIVTVAAGQHIDIFGEGETDAD